MAENCHPTLLSATLAVAAWQEKIYAIGGMDDADDATTATSVYDPALNTWSDGPALPGEPIDGFGASAYGTTAGLFATNGSGLVLRLSTDDKRWQAAGKLNHPRIAHRLVGKVDGTLVAVGGAIRGGGKVSEVEAIQVTTASK